MSNILKFEEFQPRNVTVREARFDRFPEAATPREEGLPCQRSGKSSPLGELLREAHLRAAQIIDKARGEAQRVREEAYQLGYDEGKRQGCEEGRRQGLAEGRQEGLEEGRRQLQRTLEAADRILEEVTTARDDVLRTMESQVVGLVLAVAAKIVRERAAVDHGVALRAVREAVDQLGTRELVKIRVSPADLAALRAHWRERYAGQPAERDVELIGDGRIEPGGCVVETRTAVIDAQVGVQLGAVARAFTQAAQTGWVE